MKTNLFLKVFTDKPYLILALFLTLNLLIYLPALKGELILPDQDALQQISQNQSIREVLSGFNGFTDITFSLTQSLNKPVYFKLINLLIHSLNAYLFFLLLSLIIRKKPLAVIIASLFLLIHPIQTQAVNFAFNRGILLAVFFSLLSLLFYYQAKFHARRGIGLHAGRGILFFVCLF